MTPQQLEALRGALEEIFGSVSTDVAAHAGDMTENEPRTPAYVVEATAPEQVGRMFDPDWEANGHMDRAVDLIAGWCKEQPIEGLTLEVVRLPGRTPLIYMDIPGEGDDCVLLYGHLDKQPEMVGWADGLGPWIPVMKGERLYGRGGADDGYAAFASLTAIRALQEQGGKHSRCVVLIEGCEESGSYDLPYYIDHLADRIGTPSLVVCLDSGCGNYDQLWCTTSLRGMAAGELRVDVLTEGVHSGDASGIVPSSFRIARQLLARLEDSATGQVLPKDFHVDIPDQRVSQAEVSATVLGDESWSKFPFVEGMRVRGRGGQRPACDPEPDVASRRWRSPAAMVMPVHRRTPATCCGPRRG